MLLRNFDFATKYFNYETNTELESILPLKINGWYKFVDGVLSALLMKDNNIFLLYGEKMVSIKSNYKANVKKVNDAKAEFELTDNSAVLIRFLYHSSNNFNTSPFEYIDEEDFNWGEFIMKIVNDQERQRGFITNLSEA